MKTLLDEILSQETSGNKHHTGGCGCASCAEKAKVRALYPNWRARRQQRLGLNDMHVASCRCAKCQSKQQSELEYGDDDFHTFWRRRRQLRHDWPLDVEMESYAFQPGNFSSIPNPVRQFFGQSPKQVKRKTPRGWRIIAADSGRGWKMIDEKGNERIRFMRPNPRRKGTNQNWVHTATGYWMVRDGQGNYLDGDGNIVAKNGSLGSLNDDQKFRIHVPFTGVMDELEENGLY